MKELLIRFLIGGTVVSLFSFMSDLFKPKTFAGLFGAAPSVALGSLGLTVITQGKEVVTTEVRSMILGALALLLYSGVVSHTLVRFAFRALTVSLVSLLLWLVVAVGLWFAILAS